MRILVTGGAGFIGSHLVDSLLSASHEVVIFDNMSSGRHEFIFHNLENNSNLELITGDLLNLSEISEAMIGVEMVYHLAANPDIRLGTEITDTDLRQGVIATYNVLESMRLNNCKKIAFASSSVVYGEATVIPTPENYGPLFPISLYGASKLGSEALISSWVGTFGFKAWIFRFANIIGPRGTHGVIFDFIHKLKNNPKRLEVLGNGFQEKSYMEVKDCVRAMIHVTSNTDLPLNCFNLASGDTCSVRRIAEIVVEESGLEGVEIYYTGGDRGWAGDVPKAMLGIESLDKLNFSSEYGSEDAVRYTALSLANELELI